MVAAVRLATMILMIGYRAKVLRVLRDDFDYKPAVPGLQSAPFNRVTRDIREQIAERLMPKTKLGEPPAT
jgi:hypothetical protein